MATGKMIQTDQVDPERGMRALSIEHPTEQPEPPAALAQRIKGFFPGSVAEAIFKHKLFVVIGAAIAVCVCFWYWTNPTGKPSCPGSEGRRLMSTVSDEDCPEGDEKAWYIMRSIRRDFGDDLDVGPLLGQIEGPLGPAMIPERMAQIQKEIEGDLSADDMLFGWGRGGFPHAFATLEKLKAMNQPVLQDSKWPFSPVPAIIRSIDEKAQEVVLPPVKAKLVELAGLFPQPEPTSDKDLVSQAGKLLRAAGGSETLALQSLEAVTVPSTLKEYVESAMEQCQAVLQLHQVLEMQNILRQGSEDPPLPLPLAREPGTSTFEEVVLSPVKAKLAALDGRFPQPEPTSDKDLVSQADELLRAAGGSEALALQSLEAVKFPTTLKEYVETAMKVCQDRMSSKFVRQECKDEKDNLESEKGPENALDCMAREMDRWQADKLIYVWGGSWQFKDDDAQFAGVAEASPIGVTEGDERTDSDAIDSWMQELTELPSSAGSHMPIDIQGDFPKFLGKRKFSAETAPGELKQLKKRERKQHVQKAALQTLRQMPQNPDH